MSNKAALYVQLAEETSAQITGSFQSWTAFLTTASRLYKYPFPEQLMIYAQRPEATACAEYNTWNRRMNRYVRRGSRGIALVDSSGDRPALRYVFDVADTGGKENARRPFLWQYQEEVHQEAVGAMLEARYAVSGGHGLADQLEQIAAQLAEEYWQDNREDILRIIDDSFLEGYDDHNVGVQFRSAVAVSTAYALMARCGLEPGETFVHEDFLPIFDFNTQDTVTALGMAVSQSSEQVLRQIEVTIKNYEREKLAERSQSHGGADLHTERGLPDPGPAPERRGEQAPGQIRTDAPDIPEGAAPGAVGDPDGERKTVPAPVGDRGEGQGKVGTDDARADGGGGGDRRTESQGPDGLGGPDEQLQDPGRGGDPSGVDLRLNESPALEPSSQFSLFPSEDEQLQLISEAEDAPAAPFASSAFREREAEQETHEDRLLAPTEPALDHGPPR